MRLAQSATLRNVRAAFLGHLEEEQISELLDVIAVVDAIVAQRVAKAPEFLDDVCHWLGGDERVVKPIDEGRQLLAKQFPGPRQSASLREDRLIIEVFFTDAQIFLEMFADETEPFS